MLDVGHDIHIMTIGSHTVPWTVTVLISLISCLLFIDETPAVFHCTLPPPSNTILEFRCRDSSCGALESGEKAATLAEEDYSVDPNFFDKGYSMAGSTGFKVRYYVV